jgi:hypothetical protein
MAHCIHGTGFNWSSAIIRSCMDSNRQCFWCGLTCTYHPFLKTKRRTRCEQCRTSQNYFHAPLCPIADDPPGLSACSSGPLLPSRHPSTPPPWQPFMTFECRVSASCRRGRRWERLQGCGSGPSIAADASACGMAGSWQRWRSGGGSGVGQAACEVEGGCLAQRLGA